MLFYRLPAPYRSQYAAFWMRSHNRLPSHLLQVASLNMIHCGTKIQFLKKHIANFLIMPGYDHNLYFFFCPAKETYPSTMELKITIRIPYRTCSFVDITTCNRSTVKSKKYIETATGIPNFYSGSAAGYPASGRCSEPDDDTDTKTDHNAGIDS